MAYVPPALAAPSLQRPSQNAVRYQVPVTATSDIAGNAKFIFPDVPQGQWVVGACTVAQAPAQAALAALVGIQPWGVWNGAAPSPVIQIDGRTHVEVDAQFLEPLTAYTAWVIGWSDEIDSLTFPAAAGSTLPPFATATLQAQTTSFTTGSVVLGPYAVAAAPGMRFSMVCEPLFSDCLVDLRWYDSQGIALAPGLYDFAGIFDFRVRSGDSCSFIIPHQADWLVVTLSSADGGQTRPHWSMANREQGFDLFGQGLGTGNANVDVPINTTAAVVTPPTNGPWYRIKALTARANGTPTAGGLAIFGLSDDGVTVKSWVAIAKTTATLNEVYFGDFVCDILIANPTRIVFSNPAVANIDMRVGATWEVVPPMFHFPRDT